MVLIDKYLFSVAWGYQYRHGQFDHALTLRIDKWLADESYDRRLTSHRVPGLMGGALNLEITGDPPLKARWDPTTGS